MNLINSSNKKLNSVININIIKEVVLNSLESWLNQRVKLNARDIKDILMNIWEKGLHNFAYEYSREIHNKEKKLGNLAKEIVRIMNMINNGEFDNGYIDIY